MKKEIGIPVVMIALLSLNGCVVLPVSTNGSPPRVTYEHYQDKCQHDCNLNVHKDNGALQDQPRLYQPFPTYVPLSPIVPLLQQRNYYGYPTFGNGFYFNGGFNFHHR